MMGRYNSLTQSVLQGLQCCSYYVQLKSGCLLTWEILTIQKKGKSVASAPSWARLKQTKINASGSGYKQLKNVIAIYLICKMTQIQL
jgi:hypothetical protein